MAANNSWTVGDIKCTALLDGVFQADPSIISATDEAEFAELASRKTGQSGGKFNLDVNAFLLEANGEKILIDTGTRDLYGPTLGQMSAQLAALGVTPEEINKVILTHLHNDHTGGLTTGEGDAVFKNAELIVSETEWDFWNDDDIYSNGSDGFKFAATGARAASAAYKDRVRLLGNGEDVVSGVSSIPLPGHSIGHTGYRLSSGNAQMVIWGDVVVAPQVQFTHPDWASQFDSDAGNSIASRRRIFDDVAADKIPVAGMHLPTPGLGYLTAKDSHFDFEQVS